MKRQPQPVVHDPKSDWDRNSQTTPVVKAPPTNENRPVNKTSYRKFTPFMASISLDVLFYVDDLATARQCSCRTWLLLYDELVKKL